MVQQPSGTVTLVFTDIEGSTRLLHELGQGAYREALSEHRRVIRDAFGRYAGYEVDYEGDAFMYAFASANDAVLAVAEAQAGLESGPIRIRVGIHTGEPGLDPPKYVGLDVHQAARIMSAAHGGQVLLSESTHGLVDVDAKDLGEHRLKDLSAPQRLYQLGDADFPRLRTLHQTNLPVPATPLVGRERELGELAELLSRNDVRLVTLTGTGGSGKTRLALQAAANAAERYPDGVWWMPLASLRDPALVLETAAQVLGARLELSAHIRDRQLLLLFDNFEHLIDASTGVASLVADCPGLTVLVTSREPLHLEAEWEYAVEPLREAEAVELFCQRASTVKRDFSADGEVREICLRLDCLPLAIELAAARVKVLSPGAIRARLEERLPLLTGGARDAPERQRTLRATIEWSYQLLTREEQKLLMRLSVFAGGCTLEAAEQVCEADIDTLQSLLDKSLVRRTGERYWMLETIREYAAERLEESGERELLARRHADHYLILAETANEYLGGGDRQAWVLRLELEHDNLHGALTWYAETDAGQLLSLVNAVRMLWWDHSHLVEGDRWFALALALSAGENSHLRAQALNRASGFAAVLGDQARARDLTEQAVANYRSLGDQQGLCVALSGLAGVAVGAACYEEAAAHAEEALQLARSLDIEISADTALAVLSEARAGQGRYPEAIALSSEALRGFATRGHANAVADIQLRLGYFELEQANLTRAKEHLKEALRDGIECGYRTCVVESLICLGAIAVEQGDTATAARLLAGGERFLAETGYVLWPLYQAPLERGRDAVSIRLSPAEIEAATREAEAMTLDEIADYALRVTA